jgi:hypothetical protein
MALSEKQVTEVCKMGRDKETYSYLAIGNGFICAKKNPGVKALIDQRRAQGTMTAMGDNCEGIDS